LYPALETTVGEKERATLETTLASPTGRFSLVVGKYLAVVVFALLAFILNFGSMWFTLFHLRDQFDISGLSLGVEAGVVILVAAVLLALLLSAFMMLLGFLARSFREGQAFVTPVYLLAGIPAIFAASPDVTLTPALACVPVVNISLLFREALRGDLSGWGTGLTLVSSTLYALLVLVLAARLLRREELALGGGLTVRQALQSLLGGRPGNEEREER
jgi:sodium transport system permease protein